MKLILQYIWFRVWSVLRWIPIILNESLVLIWLRPIVRDYLRWDGNTPQRMRDAMAVEERHAWAYRPAPEWAKMVCFILFVCAVSVLAAWLVNQ